MLVEISVRPSIIHAADVQERTVTAINIRTVNIFKLFKCCEQKSCNDKRVLYTLKLEVFAFKVRRSFRSKTFLRHVAGG